MTLFKIPTVVLGVDPRFSKRMAGTISKRNGAKNKIITEYSKDIKS